MRKTYRWFFVLGALLIFSSLFALSNYSFQTFLEYFLTCAEGALGFSLVYMGFHFRKQYYQAQNAMTATKAAEREAHARELSLLEQQLEVERVELEQLKAQVKQEFGENFSSISSKTERSSSRLMYYPVSGVTFKNEDGSSRQKILRSLCEGDEVGISDVSFEEYKYNGAPAIHVYTVAGCVGNIRKTSVTEFLQYLDNDDYQAYLQIESFENDDEITIYRADVVVKEFE